MQGKYGEFLLVLITIKDMGNDLGANYFNEYTLFKVWSPYAHGLKVVIYNEYYTKYGKEYNMLKSNNGIWELKLEGNHRNKYYNYRVRIGDTERETPDPYTRGASINGNRGMVVDFKSINPVGWDEHFIPHPIKPTEAIIYETHVRNFSVDKNSGMKYKGKYLAFTESGTKGKGGLSTGLDHLKELGITHIHLLPIFDFKSVDERLDSGYNWGYDPYLYNVPEGSYSTNPYDGKVRIVELKKMIKSLHENNIRVVMDVVFNHTFKTDDSPFNVLTPHHFYRLKEDGSYGDGSGCGNEIASEKPMVRKFIIDSLKFWVKEYKIDGFRFDLMALMDIETMDEIEKQLKTINPNILLYGEPWTGGDSVLNDNLQFRKGCQKGMDIGVFNDDFRNALKGDNDGNVRGFVNGGRGLEHEIKKGIVGSIYYGHDTYGFAKEPNETVNYVSSHDNLTLFDKILKTNLVSTDLEREKMNRLALSIILTSQGIPFIHGGSEILKSKGGNYNSYNAGDEVNNIKWDDKDKYLETFMYIKGLISIRNSYKAMTMNKSQDIIKNLWFIESPENTVAYILKSTYRDDFNKMLIIHNSNREDVWIHIPLPGLWRVISNGIEVNLLEYHGNEEKIESQVKVASLSTYILVQ